MPAAPVIAAEEGLGRIEPTRLGVRVAEPTAGGEPRSAPLREAPFAEGATRVEPFELSVSVEAGGAGARVDSSVRNLWDSPQRLESVVLGFRWTAPAAGSLRFLKNGWQSWSSTGSLELDDEGEAEFPSGPWLRGMHHALGAPPADRQGWHESHLVGVVASVDARTACLVGVLESGRAFGLVHLRREAESVRVEVELRVDAVLAPGESRLLEPLLLRVGREATPLLEAYAEDYGREAGARAAEPFVSGWCSWYHFFHGVTEADLLRNLEALVSAREELPVELVQLDDGWQRAVGDWLETNEKFPRGLAPLAEEIRAAGFVAGLWTAPFCAVQESAFFDKRRDWLLGRDGLLHRGLLHPYWARDGAVYVLDTSRPEVSAHLEGLFRALYGMGFHYLKLDFLYTVAMQADSADPSVSPAARLRRGLEAVRAGAGDEAFLLGCGCPLGPAVGIADAMRIGPDVAPSWSLDPAHAVPGIEETQPAARSAVRNTLARAWMHRRLWINDPDCLIARADSGLSDAERRCLGAAIAATGGSAILSDEIAALPAEARAFARETLEAARQVDALGLPGLARVPDLLERDLARQVVTSSAGADTVAVLNLGDDRATEHLDVDASLEGSPQPLLGSRAAQRRSGGRLELRLEPHEGALLRLRRSVSLAVFCDFDGTFSVQDVGRTLAVRHAGERRPALWRRYESGEITAWEYNLEILDGLPLGRAEVEEFLRSVDLDPGARDLVAWCERHRVPFRVLSDGFDFNLNRLQQLNSVRFAYDANHLRFAAGRWRIRAGGLNPACDCGTGTCKRGRIESYRAARPGVTLVHIGNGRVSDLCGALAADVAFAKDSLAEELERRGVGFEPFRTLHDVIPALARLL
jgi:alpha-galactosidase